MNKRVVLAMSGGVDSSVALHLLLKRGYEVAGVTMQVGTMSESDIEDAAKLAKRYGIEWHLIDLSEVFVKTVERYFVEEYEAGRTPNPCAFCNRAIKFGLLFDKMRARYPGCYYATGHYARIEVNDDRFFLKQAVDEKKDQSYFLARIKKERLRDLIFPLGEYDKEQVRELARDARIPVADKGESQEICFIPDDDYRQYLRKTGVCPQPGEFMLENGETPGTHNGFWQFTIGQRKGLGISYSEKLFVRSLNPLTGEVFLAPRGKMDDTGLIAEKLNDMVNRDLIMRKEDEMLKCKVRSGQRFCDASISVSGDRLHVGFKEPQFAVAPGQLCVVYDQEGRVLISGWIKGSC